MLMRSSHLALALEFLDFQHYCLQKVHKLRGIICASQRPRPSVTLLLALETINPSETLRSLLSRHA